MKREIRHPYQIMDIDELVIEQNYAFINYYCTSLRTIVDYYIFGGIIKDSGDVDETATLATFITLPDITKKIVTIHLDGWNPCKGVVRKLNDPVVVYWMESMGKGYDWLYTYLGHKKTQPGNPIVVPEQYWKKDSQIYPNIIERKIKSSAISEAIDATSWEQKMRKKKHDAMAKMLGF